MALTVTELPQRECTTANDGSRLYTRTFRVVSDNALIGQLKALTAAGVPEGFEQYTNADGSETDSEARVIRKQASQEDDEGRSWLVRVEYSTDWVPQALVGGDQGDPSLTAQDAATVGNGWTPPSAPNLPPEQAAQLNPILRPPEVSKSSQRTTKPFTHDLDGLPVVNSAGEAFDPPVMIDDGSTIITITRNVALFDVTTADRYRFCVNLNPFFGFLPGEAMLTAYSAQVVYENRIRFERVTWTFECKDGGFEFIKPLDQGYMERTIDGVRQILVGGHPPSRPLLLDGAGVQLDVETPADAVFLTFRARRRRNFADLGVPTA